MKWLQESLKILEYAHMKEVRSALKLITPQGQLVMRAEVSKKNA